ncbi:MAG: 2-hydroxyacyl-CoA dehydratase [Candidatus Abyssobacteria bacterium SURF_5]|uniref:2-hydroxyacyl-CoA dehydratase n=1 Tax=Abyssobacteria bacterium (strain SURF_5) TaxID=2093360 RepID=A0A3A4NGH9_ABYX5|nr:MAG: 2-hydroxyacyl-CoA dehydratase [Candidatus Abyssubacteria bacterium SURF_5]
MIAYFSEIARTLNNPEIQKWKQAGNPVVGTVCSNIPEEILHAAGALPLRLRAPNLQDTSNADAQLHRINCSYTRSVLQLALTGQLEFLDGLVTTNTCDHMLRLAGELQEKARVDFVHYFSMYHALGQAAEEWLVQEMRQLLETLERAFDKKISEEDIRRSIAVYNRTRSLMRRVNDLRKNDPPPLTGAEYLQLAVAGMSLPRELFNEKLEALIPQLEKRTIEANGKPRLMVVGGACDLPDFIDFIERKSAIVVADGLCFGMRHYEGQIEENAADPIRAIAKRHTKRVACPSIFNGFDNNCGVYRKIIQEWRVRAVVCARLKFCDHWAGERKMLSDEFHRDGVPLLDLEREYSTSGSGQISTRIQAFLEMLSGLKE